MSHDLCAGKSHPFTGSVGVANHGRPVGQFTGLGACAQARARVLFRLHRERGCVLSTVEVRSLSQRYWIEAILLDSYAGSDFQFTMC
jgi:hypothetical protein